MPTKAQLEAKVQLLTNRLEVANANQARKYGMTETEFNEYVRLVRDETFSVYFQLCRGLDKRDVLFPYTAAAAIMGTAFGYSLTDIYIDAVRNNPGAPPSISETYKWCEEEASHE